MSSQTFSSLFCFVVLKERVRCVDPLKYFQFFELKIYESNVFLVFFFDGPNGVGGKFTKKKRTLNDATSRLYNISIISGMREICVACVFGALSREV